MLTITSLKQTSTQNRIKSAILKTVKTAITYNIKALRTIPNSKGDNMLLIKYSVDSGFEFYDKNLKNVTGTVLKSLKMFGTL